MKRLNSLAIIICSFLSLCSPKKNNTTITTTTESNDGNMEVIDSGPGFFYLQGKKMRYEVVKNKVAFKAETAKVFNEVKSELREDNIVVDTSYKFSGNIVIIQRLASVMRKMDSLQEFYTSLTDNELGNLITLPENRSTFILTNRFVAKFKSSVTAEKIDSIGRALNCIIIERSEVRKNRVVFQCDKNLIIQKANALFETNLVEFSHPDFISEVEERDDYNPFMPNDALFSKQWHLNNTGQAGGKMNADVDAPEAWELTRGNSKTIIAIIDDAFDIDHEDLKPNLIDQRDFTNKPADNTASPEDPYSESHGTSVAGVAVAKGNNLIGVSGSCPECSFIAIRALGGSVSDHAKAIDYAVSKGAWIITNSWGYSLNSPTTDDVVDAINNAATKGRNGLGCIVFFAMTNTRVDNCIGTSPDISSLPNVIAVSRSTNKDELGNGGFGACMDLIAPTRGGTLGITTTDITGAAGSENGNYYENFGGTSSATPLVAGIAGLMLTRNPSLTRLQVQRILENTADKIDPAHANYDSRGFSVTHGYGRANAYKAVLASK